MKKFHEYVTEARIAADSWKEHLRDTSHGPLMKGGDWIKKRSTEDFIKHPELTSEGKHSAFFIGHIDNGKTQKHILIPAHHPSDKAPKNLESNLSKGYGANHAWYEDTGYGHKFPTSKLVIKGHIHVHPDGKVERSSGVDDSDMKVKRDLMVYK